MFRRFSSISLGASLIATVWALPETFSQISRQYAIPGANTSVLPPGWSGSPQCWENCAEPNQQFFLGPVLTDPMMTIELCINFCDEQHTIMAGLFLDECHCGNIINPEANCFESDGNECQTPCPGNREESCGSHTSQEPFLWNIFFKNNPTCQLFWEGGAELTSGPWRFSWFYNDSISARALPHNAVNLHQPLPRGNLTIEACVNACATAGFVLAGVEYADECYCGNELEHNSQQLSECNLSGGPNANAMRCKGNASEFCGGPNLLYVYALPGAGLGTIVPFGSEFDGFCPECGQMGQFGDF